MRPELRSFVDLFNAGRFFEAHEVLEAAWMRADLPDRFFLQGLIHAAVACHHEEQGNPVGAGLQLEKALKKLAGYLPEREGVWTSGLHRELMRWRDSGVRPSALRIMVR